MNRYIVKQIAFDKEERELPNLCGWAGAEQRSAKWAAKLALMHGDAEDFKKKYLALYNDKYEVEASDLDDVYRITNLWDSPDSVHTFEPGHSTSVGDLIEDTQDGSIYLVAGFGFKQVVAPRVAVNFEVA